MKLLRLVSMMVLLVACIPVSQVYAMSGGRPCELSSYEVEKIADYKRELALDLEFKIEAWNQCSDTLHAQAMARTSWASRRFNVLSKQYPCDAAKRILEEKMKAHEYLQDSDYQDYVKDKDLSVCGLAPQTWASLQKNPELLRICLATWQRAEVK